MGGFFFASSLAVEVRLSGQTSDFGIAQVGLRWAQQRMAVLYEGIRYHISFYTTSTTSFSIRITARGTVHG
ncbi:hypothetical protein Y032_0273g985 [Ancylostoma ceylanicum]|nr:hypothetical protein Y032_0273g985 [Ancylostoma ceylanicum]